jgi:F-type H+-transporting ATPase subunit a
VPIEIGGLDLSFTNSSLFMVATVGVAAAFLFLPQQSRPCALASAVDIGNVLRIRGQYAAGCGGDAGDAVLPPGLLAVHVRPVANLFGMFPYFFTVTSHIIVTFALAMLVIGTVIVYGF